MLNVDVVGLNNALFRGGVLDPRQKMRWVLPLLIGFGEYRDGLAAGATKLPKFGSKSAWMAGSMSKRFSERAPNKLAFEPGEL